MYVFAENSSRSNLFVVSQGKEHPRLASRIVCLSACSLACLWLCNWASAAAAAAGGKSDQNPYRDVAAAAEEDWRKEPTGCRVRWIWWLVYFYISLHKRDCLQIHFILRQPKNRRTRIELLLLFLYCCCLPGSPLVDLFIGDHELYLHRRRRSSLATTTCATLLALGCTTLAPYICRPNIFTTRTPRWRWSQAMQWRGTIVAPSSFCLTAFPSHPCWCWEDCEQYWIYIGTLAIV